MTSSSTSNQKKSRILKPNQLWVIGINEDGWEGLCPKARAFITHATTLIGGQRHLDLLPQNITQGKELQTWPTPLKPFLKILGNSYQAKAAPRPQTCILASGNPMEYGIGATLSHVIPATALTIIPNISTQTMICNLMAWPQHETTLISLCGRPINQINVQLFDRVRLVVLSENNKTPTKLAHHLCQKGFPASLITVFENLSGQNQKISSFSATSLMMDSPLFSNLNAMAVDIRANTKSQIFSTMAGLPEDAFIHDGQITKQEIRALTLSALSPRPDAILWDIGAGSGAIGIEWMRAAPRALTYAIEPRADRIKNIKQNAATFGVPTLNIIAGQAPDILNHLPSPDAIFIGGGLTQNTDTLKLCLKYLKKGGRLVINAVTIQSETTLYQAHQDHGGNLTHIQISKPDKIGKFDSWKPSRPVTQWRYTKPWV